MSSRVGRTFISRSYPDPRVLRLVNTRPTSVPDRPQYPSDLDAHAHPPGAPPSSPALPPGLRATPTNKSISGLSPDGSVPGANHRDAVTTPGSTSSRPVDRKS